MANHCKVFTTTEYAKQLLDAVNYRTNLFGNRVLENSCGDGNILIEIVKRYIEDCIRRKIPLAEIKNGLERDIVGYELEQIHFDNCIKNLDIVAAEYQMGNIQWKVTQADALKINKGFFQYIIGNPPYITYKDIDIKERIYIQQSFATCQKGKFDYYYAFIEDGIKNLQDNGILAYIIPSSIYKNVFAQELRNMIKPHITDIYDYTSERKFKDAITSSTILVLRKNSNIKFLTYHDVLHKINFNINKNKLINKWYFVKKEKSKGKLRFGDYFRVSNCIATLYNDAFILDAYIETTNGYQVGDFLLETELIRNACSMKSLRKNENNKIIFPYQYVEGNITHINEVDFQNNYPGIYMYLTQFKEALGNRKADITASWFEYGRSQALDNMHERKLLMSSVLTEEVKCRLIDEYTIPYAGIYIQPIGNMSLEQAQQILMSQEFWNYISKRSIDSTGKSKRISVKEIQNYTFD